MGASSIRPAAVSIRSAFRFAWSALWRRFGLFAGILITMVAAWVVLEVAVIGGQRFGVVLWLVAHIAFLIFFAGLEAGLVRVCLDVCDGGSPTAASAFTQLALGPKFLAGQMAYLLMVAIGLALLVIPGLYILGRFSLFGYQLIDSGGNLAASFGQSAALSRGEAPRVTGLALLLMLMNLLGASLLGVGLFVTIPLSVLVMAAIYRQLTEALSD